MATLTIALTETITASLGAVPPGMTTAISGLSASQRDDFVMAWLRSSADQHQRPATMWSIKEDDRAAFEKFRTTLNTSAVVA